MTISLLSPTFAELPEGRMVVTVQGSGPVNTTLEILLNGNIVTTVVTDGSGNFSKTFETTKTSGTNSINVRSTDDSKGAFADFEVVNLAALVSEPENVRIHIY